MGARGQNGRPSVLLAALPLVLLVCATMVMARGAGASSRTVHLGMVQPQGKAGGRKLQQLQAAFLLYTRLRPWLKAIKTAKRAYNFADNVYDLQQQLSSIPDSGGELCYTSNQPGCQDSAYSSYYGSQVQQASCSWAGYYQYELGQVYGENCLDQLSAQLTTIYQQRQIVFYSGIYYRFDSADPYYQCTWICEGGGYGASYSGNGNAGTRAHISLNAAFVGALGATALGLGML